ncbi:cathepsin L [Eurosta solidaginis]|uniref:cathepsin L n=1 Tax=Eurosta solidaginis TaxID=178769 RepID=UPI0035312DCF
MCGAKELYAVLLLTTVLTVNFSDANLVAINSAEWTTYKATYSKTYTTANPESYALYYYNYNKKLINSYNLLADRGQRTYRLAINQFTDMRLIQFNALFPKTTPPTTTSATTPPSVQTAPASFDPIADLGLVAEVENQGTACNSGWAYASAKAIEIFVANQNGVTTTTPLSAQNLIDCAGSGAGCTRQVSQTAFDYLVQFQQPLYSKAQYPDNNLQATQGMCLPPTTATGTPINLATYSRITDADDATMMQYVAAGYPVVIEYDPTTFDFMHYSSGIFQQPRTSGGSHYMTVLGYGTDTVSSLDYWLVLNSFGTTWGENGYIRIRRNVPLAKSALFPTSLRP